jgi:hypothetical protein
MYVKRRLMSEMSDLFSAGRWLISHILHRHPELKKKEFRTFDCTTGRTGGPSLGKLAREQVFSAKEALEPR